VDFGVASLVLAGLMVWYRVPLTLTSDDRCGGKLSQRTELMASC